MTVKSSISLTDEQHTFAKSLVDAGHFPSVSAVLQQGVQLLREKMAHESTEHAALAELLRERQAGKFVSATKMDDRIARLIARKRKAHAVRD